MKDDDDDDGKSSSSLTATLFLFLFFKLANNEKKPNDFFFHHHLDYNHEYFHCFFCLEKDFSWNSFFIVASGILLWISVQFFFCLVFLNFDFWFIFGFSRTARQPAKKKRFSTPFWQLKENMYFVIDKCVDVSVWSQGGLPSGNKKQPTFIISIYLCDDVLMIFFVDKRSEENIKRCNNESMNKSEFVWLRYYHWKSLNFFFLMLFKQKQSKKAMKKQHWNTKVAHLFARENEWMKNINLFIECYIFLWKNMVHHQQQV